MQDKITFGLAADTASCRLLMSYSLIGVDSNFLFLALMASFFLLLNFALSFDDKKEQVELSEMPPLILPLEFTQHADTRGHHPP